MITFLPFWLAGTVLVATVALVLFAVATLISWFPHLVIWTILLLLGATVGWCLQERSLGR